MHSRNQIWVNARLPHLTTETPDPVGHPDVRVHRCGRCGGERRVLVDARRFQGAVALFVASHQHGVRWEACPWDGP